LPTKSPAFISVLGLLFLPPGEICINPYPSTDDIYQEPVSFILSGSSKHEIPQQSSGFHSLGGIDTEKMLCQLMETLWPIPFTLMQ
jgi:hypothetical protein